MTRILAVTILLGLLMFTAGCKGAQVKEAKAEDGAKVVKIAPLESHEDCAEMMRGDFLSYSFETSKPVDFNIHYHGESHITYAVSKGNISADSGKFNPEKRQFYCMMWTNKQSEPVTLTYKFSIGKR